MNERRPPICMTHDVEEILQRGARTAHDRGKETCFLLFAQDGVIVRAIRAGQPVEHAAMTRPDFDAADVVVREMREEGLLHVGQAHVHLGYGPASSGDINTLREVAANGWPGYVCIVANVTGTAPATLTAHSVDGNGTVCEHDIEILDARPDYEPVIPAERKSVKYLQFGLGSGGCTVAHQSSLWGLDEVMYVDHDTLEERNASRHYASRRDAKKRITKTRWVRDFIRPRTTSSVQTSTRKVTPQHRDWLRGTIAAHDIIAECTGHPVVRELISAECKTLRKPLVTAGVFAQASGGYVFVQHPRDGAACNRCLFKLTKHSASDDHETLEQLTRDYGFTPEQLERQLGLFTDVSLTATLQAKVLLDLIRGVEHDENLYLIDNQALTIRKAFVKQSSNCSLCHPDLAH